MNLVKAPWFCLVLIAVFSWIDVSAQFYYYHPLHNSKNNSPQTNIVLKTHGLFSDQTKFENYIEVLCNGQEADFDCSISEHNKTLIITPREPFERNAVVEVKVKGLMNIDQEIMNELNFSFEVSPYFPSELIQKQDDLSDDYFDVKALMPDYQVVVNTFAASTDPIFLRNNAPGNASNRYTAIIDNDGEAQYLFQHPQKGLNFDLQPSGYLSYYAPVDFSFRLLDTSYTEIDSIYAGNGYYADLHEFIQTPDGHFFLLIYDTQPLDMSTIYPGGLPEATPTGLVIQELDENKQVVFQWRSWDHYDVLDCMYCDFTQTVFDYVHGNSIEIDNDSTLIISAKNMQEITKIDRNTGDIIWRWGGYNNEFTMIGDSIGFSYQHDVRRIGNGNITLFDNGNKHIPQISRAKEYVLDEVNKTATLIWSFMHADSLYGKAMGNVQRLPDGNTFICWGWVNPGDPSVTEVDAAGNVVYEAILQNFGQTYRAHRYAWYPQFVALNEQTNDGLNIYPNPVSGMLSVQSVNPVIELYLTDLNGNKVLSVANPLNNQLDVSRLSSGVYILNIRTETVFTSKKLIVVH